MARSRIWLPALALLAAGGLAAETPAHYIVFTAEEGGDPRPVFHRRVSLESPLDGDPQQPPKREIPRDSRAVAFSLVDTEGTTLLRDTAVVPAWIRGEFHGEPQGGTRWSIDGHLFPAPRTSFVLRLPVVPGARLVFDGHAKAAFDLDSLEASAGSLPLAALAGKTAHADFRAKSGSPANRADLLILGDGYTTAEAGKFAADVAAMEVQFFGISPYREYRSFVNVVSLFTPSAQSGADHPPYRAGCVADDPACCADTTAQTDPLSGTYVDTALGGRFCSFNIHRLVVIDEAAALAAAAAVPDWDRILILVNDTTYGGSGGSVLVSSLHPQAPDVVRHEYGHAFTDLADEYESPFPGYPLCSDVSGSVRCEPNVTDQTSRRRLKWAPWVAGSTPLPTPEGSAAFTNQTGLFEGARYLSSGMYRHRDTDCLMLALGQPFRDVCSQEYVLRLYRGGWGNPAAGIDLIEPGSESPRPGTVPSAPSVTFSVRLLQPSSGPPLSVRWFVDGVQVPGATGSSFTYRPARSGNHTVEVKVRDTTPFVHPTLAGSDLESTRRWRLSRTAATPTVGEIGLNEPAADDKQP